MSHPGTLMYLAHGGSLQVMAWTFKIGVSTARNIIRETCDIIWVELHTIYLAPPNNNEWRTIAQNFWRKRQMPNCIGAIDGKHIHITCPAKSGSLYFNYKKHHSIVLLAACDANYCFLAVDVGAYGSRSDGGIFGYSAFGRKLSNGKLNIPESQTLPNSNIKYPFYFVGNAAFPLKKNLMRPYPGRDLSLEKEKFNKRLSRARCLIENSFGILANRWRILGTKMNCSPKIATKFVLAVTVLHNFLMLMKSSEYCPDDYCDTEEEDVILEGRWRQEGIELESTKAFRVNRASREAFNLRDTLAGYFYNN